jgi:hypothetical protein
MTLEASHSGMPSPNLQETRLQCFFRHSGGGRNPAARFWTPASAGVTKPCYLEALHPGVPNPNLQVTRLQCFFRHSGESRNPVFRRFWAPAFAGMTGLCYSDETLLLRRFLQNRFVQLRLSVLLLFNGLRARARKLLLSFIKF